MKHLVLVIALLFACGKSADVAGPVTQIIEYSNPGENMTLNIISSVKDGNRTNVTGTVTNNNDFMVIDCYLVIVDTARCDNLKHEILDAIKPGATSTTFYFSTLLSDFVIKIFASEL